MPTSQTKPAQRCLHSVERQQDSTSQDQGKKSVLTGVGGSHDMLYPHTQTKSKHPFPSPISNPHDTFIENRELKRKRSPSPSPPRKKPTSPSKSDAIQLDEDIPRHHTPPEPLTRICEDTICEVTPTHIDEERKIHHIDYWRKKGNYWPKDYFSEAILDSETPQVDNMNPPPFVQPRTRRRKPSETNSSVISSSSGINNQKSRESKSNFYKSSTYEILLSAQNSFMKSSGFGITDVSEKLCQTLLNSDQTIPMPSLFNDAIFKQTCQKIQDRNEARVIQDIARLIIPSAETFATYGATHLNCLIESVNEAWKMSIPLHGPPRPQPDYSVGFARSAFTEDEIKKLTPYTGNLGDDVPNYFMGRFQMYFPFLTGEVKCGSEATMIADRQNIHSMTLAVRGIVELFKLVQREKQLHREIVAFSISHDHEQVKIYGHYPIIDDGQRTQFYRHQIRAFHFTDLNGKDKWSAYKFVKNVYDIWMPMHLERIRSVINDIPSHLNVDVVDSRSQSQDLGSENLMDADAQSLMGSEHDTQSLMGSEHDSRDTWTSREMEGMSQGSKKRGRME